MTAIFEKIWLAKRNRFFSLINKILYNIEGMFVNVILVVTITFGIGAYVWQNLPRHSYVASTLDASYHYIIVGGGTAGSVLAHRLSADPSIKVLLLEAGCEDSEKQIAEIPVAAWELQRKEVDWSYLIEPQRNACHSFENNQLRWASGRALGGSSLISNLVYSRGNPRDYEKWGAEGCEGWKYVDVLPYFIKAETTSNAFLSQSEYHGRLGPQVVSYMSGTSLSSYFLRAGLELGHRQVDYNSEEQLGVSNVQANTVRGARQSSASAYLTPVMHRPNLHVATHAYVRKVLLTKKRAVGVEVLRNNTVYTIKARREVILAAGTVGSAKLLQLSGIGPRSVLEKHGIPVVQELPVGENLHDHVFPLGLQYSINQSLSATEQSSKTLAALVNYLLFGDGAMSSSGVDGIGFFHSSDVTVTSRAPALELQLHNSLLATMRNPEKRESVRRTLNMKSEVFDATMNHNHDQHGFLLLPILLHPASRGHVTIRSADFRDPPVIDPRFLSERRDEDILLEGIHLAQRFANTRTFASLGTKPRRQKLPTCNFSGDSKTMADADETYWRCFLRSNLYSMHHGGGTCRMGHASDPRTVVTPDLRVKGVQNLRVVDASVLPHPLSGDPAAAVVMVAEKASDVILGRVTVRMRGEAEVGGGELAEFDIDTHDEL